MKVLVISLSILVGIGVYGWYKINQQIKKNIDRLGWFSQTWRYLYVLSERMNIPKRVSNETEKFRRIWNSRDEWSSSLKKKSHEIWCFKLMSYLCGTLLSK